MASSAQKRLQDYVAIPSINPMGRTDQPAEWVGEARMVAHLEEEMRQLGIDAEVVGTSDRPSLVAHVSSGRTDAETIMVASHIDTVPVDGMDIPPFDPVVSNGQLSGRGSCDTKGGMAALVASLERVLKKGTLKRNLILVGESDEELGSQGVKDVLAALGSSRPDWVLATEPTEMKVVHRHKGVALIRLHAKGRSCHSSNPSEGRNALLTLSRAALALEDLHRRLGVEPDPQLGPGTISVGQMGGGQAPNIVPDHGFLVADRRMLPGETLEKVRTEVEEALQAARVWDDVDLVACVMGKPPLSTPADHACVSQCRRAMEAAGLSSATGTVAFGTDAGVFEQSGLPGVVLGPGSILRAHTSTEYVELDQLEAMTDFFESLLENS
ncbi:MAG: M20 family metallopeptidase [Myxococcota bacterium]